MEFHAPELDVRALWICDARLLCRAIMFHPLRGISERTFDWGNTILFVFLAIVSLLVWALRTHILARRVSYFVLKGMFILNRLIRQIPQ